MTSSADWPSRLGRAVGCLLVPSAVALLILAMVYEPWEPYYGRLKSVYDPVLKRMRCLDDNGELSDIPAPCLYVTLKGRRAVEKKTKACEATGRGHDDCSDEAWTWLRQYIPK